MVFNKELIMKIKFIILCGILFLSFNSLGQSEKPNDLDQLKCKQFIKKGEDLLDEGRIGDAYMEFKAAIQKDPNSWKGYFLLAKTELEFNNFYAADENLKKALLFIKEEKNAELFFLQGKIKHRLGILDTAFVFYTLAKEKFGNKIADDFGIPILIAQCKFALEQKDNGVLNKRSAFSSKVNSIHDEYGAILAGDGLHLFFTSRTPETTGSNQNYDDQRFFEDINHFEWDTETNDWTIAPKAIEGINTEGFDALNYISKAGKYALGTINTSASKEKTTKSSDIFEIITEDPLFFEGIELVKNKTINTSYFDGSATITDTIFSDNGDFFQILYFVSDRNAEKSLTDIYCIEKKNGVWMEMKTLLKTINTDGRETTPFISPNGRFLFFSSDALPGMGGYDIYYSENLNGVWGNPINLGATFNTVNDDTHFQVYKHLSKAVMAGINEHEGVFNYDIFQVDLNGLDFPFLKD